MFARLAVEKRRGHSRKPDTVRDRIERLVAAPILNFFRETKQGGECWGNQVALFDSGIVSTRRHPSRLVDAPTLPL
jgi:N6-adenosine-specific RNA methylase IME4